MPASSWTKPIAAVVLGLWVAFSLWSYLEGTLAGTVLTGAIFTGGLLLGYAIYRDSRETLEAVEWPRFRGRHYVLGALVPGLNVFAGTAYLLNRAEIGYHDRPLLSRERVVALWRRPRGFAYTLYSGLGIAVSMFVLYVLFVSFVVQPVFGDVALVDQGSAVVFLAILVATLWIHRYSRPERRRDIDYAFRDVSVRLLGILGVAVIAIIAAFVLVVPAGLIGGLLQAFAGEALGTSFGFSLIYPVLLVPLAVLFALLLRVFPWFQAVPFLLNRAWSSAVRRGADVVPDSFRRESAESSTGSPIVPVAGHDHTSLEVFEATRVESENAFGYEPRPITEVAGSSLPSSVRRGIVLLVPGYLYAVAAFTFFQLRPGQATAYASLFPASDIILVGLSFAGIPRAAIAGVISQVGLAPETISLGFIGLVIPAALMIPGAWHLALEYEGLLYRFHERLGDANHLLVLWAIHLTMVAPVILAYTWYRGRTA